MDKQAALLELFKAGKIPGESNVPKHIETVISNVFLFGDRVYKLYKGDNDFFNQFNDLSKSAVRKAFTKADFEWNQQLAKEVYLDLQGVRLSDGSIEFVDEDAADDLVQITKQLPTDAILFTRLLASELSEEDFRSMGQQLGSRESGLKFEGAWPTESLLQNVLGRHSDVSEWLKSVDQHIPIPESEKYLSILRELIDSLYKDTTSSDLAVCFDAHSLNAFYVNGTLYPFDTYSPKPDWRFGPPLLNAYRIGVDIYALSGETAFKAFMDGYRESRGIAAPSEKLERFMVIYAAVIMVPYLFMIGQSDGVKLQAVAKYLSFLREYASR